MKAAGQWLAWTILAAAIACGPASADPDASLMRTCTDMDGHSFSWQWSNVPFASVCTDQPGRKDNAVPAGRPCNSGCANTAIACISLTFAADDHGQACSTNHAACLKACENAVNGLQGR